MARFGWCLQRKICFWIVFSIISACFVRCWQSDEQKSNRKSREIVDKNQNKTSNHFRTTTLHLEGVDLRSNAYLAFTTEQGVTGSTCNESYFIVQDILVTSIDGSSGEIEVNSSLQALLSTSWNLCIRQQTPRGKIWTHIGKYETYPSSAFAKRSGDLITVLLFYRLAKNRTRKNARTTVDSIQSSS